MFKESFCQSKCIECFYLFVYQILTGTFELMILQIGYALALQVVGRMASGVLRQPRGMPQIPGQPGQLTVAVQQIVAEPQRA